MDDETRTRFHAQSNEMHLMGARVLVAEGQIKALERAMENTASVHQIRTLNEMLDLKLELIRRDIRGVVDDITPVKKAMYGLIVIVMVAVIGAVVAGVLK